MTTNLFQKSSAVLLTFAMISQIAFADLARANSGAPPDPWANDGSGLGNGTGNDNPLQCPSDEWYCSDNGLKIPDPTLPNGGSTIPGSGTGGGWGNTGPTNPNDPFGQANPWPTDPNGGWGNSNNNGWGNMGGNPDDPTGQLGNYWGSGNLGYGYGMDQSLMFIKMTGVIQKNYNSYISKMRQESGYKSDDTIAYEIIKKYSLASAETAALMGAMSVIANKVTSSMFSNNWMVGGATLGTMALQTYFEFEQLFNNQATMILELAALYGSLPDDADARLQLLEKAFALSGFTGIGFGAGQNWLSDYLKTAFKVNLPKTPPIPSPGPGPFPGQFFASGAQTAESAAATTADQAGEAAAKKAAASAAKKLATETVAKNSLRAAGTRLAVDVFVTFLGGILAGAVDFAGTHWLGVRSMATFKGENIVRRAAARTYLRREALTRQTMWLILVRDVFQRMVLPEPTLDQAVKPISTKLPPAKNSEGEKNAKIYAAIVASELPLVRHQGYDELISILDKFRKNPKLIDENLNQIRIITKDNADAKLYFMKVIMGGMLMKGGFDPDDLLSLDTISKELGLMPPNEAALNSLNPNDRKISAMDRYKALRYQMQTSAQLRYDIIQRHDARYPKILKNQKWGPGGQIIIEDFDETLGADKVYETIAKYKVDSPQAQKALNAQSDQLAKKLAPKGTAPKPIGTVPGAATKPPGTPGAQIPQKGMPAKPGDKPTEVPQGIQFTK